MQPFPLCASPLVLPPPLAHGPSPCMQPFPLHVALPLACGIAREEGTRGALSLLHHQQTLGALPDSTVVLIDGIVIHSTHSVCRNVYELRSAPVVLL